MYVIRFVVVRSEKFSAWISIPITGLWAWLTGIQLDVVGAHPIGGFTPYRAR